MNQLDYTFFLKFWSFFYLELVVHGKTKGTVRNKGRERENREEIYNIIYIYTGTKALKLSIPNGRLFKCRLRK